jgi:hypothetical protein
VTLDVLDRGEVLNAAIDVPPVRKRREIGEVLADNVLRAGDDGRLPDRSVVSIPEFGPGRRPGIAPE